MNTVQTYLVKWGEKRISATPMPKFWEKVGERREKWCDGCGREKMNFGNDIAKKNWIAKIGRLKKEKEKNKTVARVMLRPHAILPYFLQTVVMTNFLLFLISAYQ